MPHDLRYRIHAFGMAHDTLYIFAAGALFSVRLGHPPFNASYGKSPFHLTNQLPNNFYRAYRIFNYNYATLVLELDQDWELFIIGSNLQDTVPCCSRIWHTQQIVRNRLHHTAGKGYHQTYEAPPNVFVYGFNAFFADNATEVNGTAQYGLDRVINGERFFFHVQSRLSPADKITRLYSITRYEQSKKGTPFAFKVEPYVIYPQEACSFANTTKSWFLERKNRLTNEQIEQLLPVTTSRLAARFPIVMLKNGYIYGRVMYLSKLDYLEMYNFTEVDGPGKIAVTWVGKIASEKVLTCRLENDDNAQYYFTMKASVAFLALILALSIAVTMNKLNSGPTRRYLVLEEGELVLLTERMIFRQKEKASKKSLKKGTTSKSTLKFKRE